MAVSSTSWFNNGIAGQTMCGADVDITKSDATPVFAVGQRYVRSDGAEFVYSHFGADTGPGKLCSQDVSESSENDGAAAPVSPADCVNTLDGTTGSHFLELTIASITADEFAGGYLVITDGTGEGYVRRIRSNTATNNPATGNIRVELYEPLNTIVHGSDATTAIVGCKYANLEASSQASSPSDVIFAGVSCSDMDVSEAAYGWVQTKGVAAVLTQGASVAGKLAFQSFIGPAGAIWAITGDVDNDTITRSVGYILKGVADTEYSIVDLNL